jgi:hypothetical protein
MDAAGLRWWLLPNIPVAPPRGPAIDIWLKLVPTASIFLATPTRGHYSNHYHYKQDKFLGKIFLGPCSAKNPGIITSLKFKSTNCGTTLFIGMTKNVEKAVSRVGGLRIFGIAFKLLGYDVCSVLNTILASLHKPFDGPLHRMLQGDAGVTALEAHEHLVGHHLCESVALLLQAATDGLLQLGYLPHG